MLIWGRRNSRGNAQVEFALCSLFVVFVLISIFDMARGLWTYVTLAEAVRDGTRYAVVRGAGYMDPDTKARLPGATLGDVKNVVLRSAVGLVPSQLTLTFESNAGVITCSPGCSSSESANWPPDAAAARDLEIGIGAKYPYNSFIVMYFPGGKGIEFGKYVLGSTARERIVF